jgi:hypothetical protein
MSSHLCKKWVNELEKHIQVPGRQRCTERVLALSCCAACSHVAQRGVLWQAHLLPMQRRSGTAYFSQEGNRVVQAPTFGLAIAAIEPYHCATIASCVMAAIL